MSLIDTVFGLSIALTNVLSACPATSVQAITSANQPVLNLIVIHGAPCRIRIVPSEEGRTLIPVTNPSRGSVAADKMGVTYTRRWIGKADDAFLARVLDRMGNEVQTATVIVSIE